MTNNRRFDYGRIALILVIVILGIFAIDFCHRLWRQWKGAQGTLNVHTSSSQVDSLGDESSVADQTVTDLTGASAGTGGGESFIETTTTSAVSVPSDYSVLQIASSTANTGSLILVNKQHLYNGTPELTAFVDINYSHLRLPSTALTINKITVDSVVAMFNDFYAATGFGDMMIYATTNEPSSVQYGTDIPERATGLSLDLGVLNEAAGYHTPYTSSSYPWLAEHAADYGYVLRFPEGKEDKTGQSAMSWHYRYVGVPHATYMYQNNLCLEEYLELVANHPWESEHLSVAVNGTAYEIYYVKAATGSNVTEVPYPSGSEPIISGDNMNGFVVACAKTTAAEAAEPVSAETTTAAAQ